MQKQTPIGAICNDLGFDRQPATHVMDLFGVAVNQMPSGGIFNKPRTVRGANEVADKEASIFV